MDPPNGRRVRRTTLPNGLQVILAPIPGAPTASVWVWYRVGSKNEAPGITGASHWVEHMLFLGSPRYPKGAIDRAVVEVGGTLNAFTDVDFTAYFITVPREHLAVPLDIESDRMTRALFRPEEVERERSIIHSEREGNENWPEYRVYEEMAGLAFRQHPYRWDPLGWRTDIESLSPEALAGYYRRFYGTRNATLVVAGGFELPAVGAEIARRFGPLESIGQDPTVSIREPEQRGERRAHLSGPGTTPIVAIAYKAPAVDSPEIAATILLDVLLGGETRLFTAGTSWRASADHPSSRLYRELVSRGLAVRAGSEWRPTANPGLFNIHLQAARGVPAARLESACDAVVDRLVRSGPTAAELSAAREKIRRGAELAYEGASRTGFRLGFFSLLGPPEFEGALLTRLLRLSATEIREQAQRLFARERRMVVHYAPTTEGRAA